METKHRIEALSDAVFAVAMTLLILDIKVPIGVAPGQIGAALAKDGMSWFSFGLTFFIAAKLWVAQHEVLRLFTEISDTSRNLNFLFLALVCVVPFLVSLINRYGSELLVVTLYFFNFAAAQYVLFAQLQIALRRGEVDWDNRVAYLRWGLFSGTILFAVTPLIWRYQTSYWWAWFLFAAMIQRWLTKRMSSGLR